MPRSSMYKVGFATFAAGVGLILAISSAGAHVSQAPTSKAQVSSKSMLSKLVDAAATARFQQNIALKGLANAEIKTEADEAAALLAKQQAEAAAAAAAAAENETTEDPAPDAEDTAEASAEQQEDAAERAAEQQEDASETEGTPADEQEDATEKANEKAEDASERSAAQAEDASETPADPTDESEGDHHDKESSSGADHEHQGGDNFSQKKD